MHQKAAILALVEEMGAVSANLAAACAVQGTATAALGAQALANGRQRVRGGPRPGSGALMQTSVSVGSCAASVAAPGVTIIPAAGLGAAMGSGPGVQGGPIGLD